MKITLMKTNYINESSLPIDYITTCKATDFSILLGCETFNQNYCSCFSYDQTCGWGKNYFQNITMDDKLVNRDTYNLGIRPVLKYSEVKSLCRDIPSIAVKKVAFLTLPKETQDFSKIENLYRNGELCETGDSYPIIHVNSDNCKKNLFHKKYTLDYLKGYKNSIFEEPLVRMNAQLSRPYAKLSNGRIIANGEAAWLKSSDIIWLVDEENDFMITEEAIYSGIPFDTRDNKSFEKSFIYKFLNKTLIESLIQNKERTLQKRYIKKIS